MSSGLPARSTTGPFALLTGAPRLLALGVLTAVAQSALLVPLALIVRSVFDDRLKAGDEGAIVVAGAAILALYCTAALLGYLSLRAAIGMASSIAARLRDDLVAKLHALPQSWHDRQDAGVVHSVIVQDSERVERMLAELANPIVPAALVALVLTIVAFVLSPVLFLTMLVAIPALFVGGNVLGRRSRIRTYAWADAGRVFAAEVHRTLRTVTLTKVHAASAGQAERAGERAARLAASMRELGAIRAAYAAAQNVLGAVAGSLILTVGGIAVIRHALTLGELLAFYALLALLLRQLQAITSALPHVAVGLDSLSHVESFLATDAVEPYRAGGAAPRFRGAISLQRVTFAYDEAPVIRGVDLEIGTAERLAIVGPNGAGKSTLVALMAGLYKPRSGRVLADGVPFEQLDMAAFIRQIGVVLQDPVVFPGTLRENIAFGRSGASDDEIRAAAEAATAHAFVERLPAGYDTRVGDEGVGLSGGQRQRIAIARALLGAPALLLLDEPTTYLDEAAVIALMANLSGLKRPPTIIIVTHDPQAARHAERVIELRDGRVVADSASPIVAASAL